MKTLFPYLEFLHYFGFSVPTFVELYPFTLWGGGAMVKDLSPQCGGEEFKSHTCNLGYLGDLTW